MTDSRHTPRWPKRRHDRMSALGQICRIRLALWLWRLAAALLAIGATMLKYQFIGPVGMCNIWRFADMIEHWAVGIKRRRY